MATLEEQIEWSRATAQRLLEPLGRRWIHVQGVAAAAAVVGRSLGEDGEVLTAAAYLHDIGYAPELAQEDFHPLDGARFVRRQGSETLARLVAHHSGARVEAELRGLDDYVEEFPFLDSELDQALTYCDLTTGPDGSPVSFEERVAEIVQRYGPDDVTARAIRICVPEFELAVVETERRMVDAGVDLHALTNGRLTA